MRQRVSTLSKFEEVKFLKSENASLIKSVKRIESLEEKVESLKKENESLNEVIRTLNEERVQSSTKQRNEEENKNEDWSKVEKRLGWKGTRSENFLHLRNRFEVLSQE